MIFMALWLWDFYPDIARQVEEGKVRLTPAYYKARHEAEVAFLCSLREARR